MPRYTRPGGEAGPDEGAGGSHGLRQLHRVELDRRVSSISNVLYVIVLHWTMPRLLASGSDDKTVILWRGLAGKKVAQVV